MATLLFSRDGILRGNITTFHPETGQQDGGWLPLAAIEASINKDAFLKSVSADIKIEEGITVLEIFENLAPWAEAMTPIAAMDFPAFLEEARKSKTDPCDEQIDEVSHIELAYTATLKPVPKFNRKADDKRIFGGEPSPSGLFDLTSGWDFRAVLKEDAKEKYDNHDFIALSFNPISEWAHLPVHIREDAYLADQSSMSLNARFMGTDMPLTNADHPLIEVHTSNSVKEHRIPLEAPRLNFQDVLLNCFFLEIGFHYSPMRRDEIGDSLKKQVEDIKEGLVKTIPAEDITFERPQDRDIPDEEMEEYLADIQDIRDVEAAAAKLGLTSIPSGYSE